jgi:hypothetical protein
MNGASTGFFAASWDKMAATGRRRALAHGRLLKNRAERRQGVELSVADQEPLFGIPYLFSLIMRLMVE